MDYTVFFQTAVLKYISVCHRDSLGPLRVNEVLNSFDNTGNVCKYTFHPNTLSLVCVVYQSVCRIMFTVEFILPTPLPGFYL